MKKLISLTMVLRKNTSVFSTGKRKISKIILPILLISMLPLAVLFGYLTGIAYDSLITIQQEGVIITFALGITSVIIFFFGVFHVLGTFYYSEDINILLYMPFKPYQILVSKLMILLIYEYLTETITLLPVLIIFGYKSHGGILYILMATLTFLLLPLIALVMSSIIVMVIMRFTNFGQHKEKLRFIGGILALFVSLGLNFLFQSQMNNIEDENFLLQMFAEGNNTMIKLISKIFPGTEFAAKSLTNPTSIEGLWMFLLFLGTCTVAIVLFIFVGQSLYFKGVIGMSEVSGKRAKISQADFHRSTERKSPLISLMSKEFKLLLRSPIYFLNCLLMAVLMPMILVGIFIFIPNSDPDIVFLLNLLTNPDSYPVMIVAVVGFLLMMASFNGIAPSAISREGKSAYIMKYLPISMDRIILSKVLIGFLVSITSGIISCLGFFILGLPVIIILLGFILGSLGVLLINQTGLIFDLINPKLNWDNEQQAVKQNMNILFNMIAMLLIAGGLIFATIKLDFSFLTVLLISSVGFILLNLLAFGLIKNKLIPSFIKMNI